MRCGKKEVLGLAGLPLCISRRKVTGYAAGGQISVGRAGKTSGLTIRSRARKGSRGGVCAGRRGMS